MHTGLWKMGSGLAAAGRPEMTSLGLERNQNLHKEYSAVAICSEISSEILVQVVAQTCPLHSWVPGPGNRRQQDSKGGSATNSGISGVPGQTKPAYGFTICSDQE
jgi:hypothetical protein